MEEKKACCENNEIRSEDLMNEEMENISGGGDGTNEVKYWYRCTNCGCSFTLYGELGETIRCISCGQMTAVRQGRAR